MRWLLRLGLGATNNTRTSYDEVVITPPVQFHAALALAEKVADKMLNLAIVKAKRAIPIVLGGDEFARSTVKADFTARVLTCAGELDYLAGEQPGAWRLRPDDWPSPGMSDPLLGKVDVVIGPAGESLEWALALGVGREAAQMGARMVREFAGTASFNQLH